jgi:hypothetical protein
VGRAGELSDHHVRLALDGKNGIQPGGLWRLVQRQQRHHEARIEVAQDVGLKVELRTGTVKATVIIEARHQ